MKKVFLTVKSAFVVGAGKVAKPGDVVEVKESVAKDLLNRGKAEIAVVAAQDYDDDAKGNDETGGDETGGDETGGDSAATTGSKSKRGGKGK